MAKFILALCVMFFAAPVAAQDNSSVATPARLYTVKYGNSLSRIARRLYGDASSWKLIAAENNIQGTKYIIHPGQVLRIPNLPSRPSFSANSLPRVKPVPSHNSAKKTPAPKTDAYASAPTLLDSKPLPTFFWPFTSVEQYRTMLGLARIPSGPGQKIKVRAMLTAYDACPLCTEKHPGDPKYGVTAIGRNALVADGVAVEPKLIPYRSCVEIPGVGIRMVDDTGVAMRQRASRGVLQIDVRKETHEEALAFGVQYRDIYVSRCTDAGPPGTQKGQD